MVVLNTPQLVQQLLDQRTVTTSDRPTLYIIDVITGGLNVPLMRYGKSSWQRKSLAYATSGLPGQLWKDYRRALRDLLSHEACQNHQRVQHAEATQLSYDLYKAPQVRAILSSSRRTLLSAVSRTSSRMSGATVPQRSSPLRSGSAALVTPTL